MNRVILFTILFLLLALQKNIAQCGPGTPVYTANLIGIPNGTIITPNIPRNDTCCGSTAPDKCIEIVIYLDANAMGINFQVYGALPPGALYYQINCGPQISVGSPICLNGQGPHILTFCKPGNNINSYGIISIPAPEIPDSILVRNGCSGTLATTGFSVPTITWNSIYPGLPGAYNSYLNCSVGCATVTATPSGTPPAYVDYLVGGYAIAPCQSNYYSDTVRVYFYQNLLANITPSNPTICFGGSSAILTASASGGLAPYTYTWSNSVVNQSVSVGPGTFVVNVSDNTGCPPTTATAIVNQFTAAITANPGPAQNLFKITPTISLNGGITIASGGIWSGGTGTFNPSSTLLTTSYIPSAAEVNSGSVQLVLTSTGNQGCPPGSGTINISFQNTTSVNAGSDKTVCANNNVTALGGTVSGFPSTILWSTLGSGTFSGTTGTANSYTPSLTDISNSTVNVVLSATNNGVCPGASDTVKIIITPKPIVNAGPDQIICSTNAAVISGSVSAATTTGTWSTSGNGTFSPNASALNATYTPGTNDISAGTVSLVLSSTNNGNCLVERDTLKLTIIKNVTVNAGLNQALCSNAASISLQGTVIGGTSTVQWATAGTGNFMLSTNSLTSSYAFSGTDITNGSVIFTLSSTNTGPCPVSIDTVKMTIRTLATVTTGINQVLCSSQNTIGISGVITGSAGTGTWTASGTGPFTPGNSNLSTTYSMTSNDINTGSVTFTLTSTNNGVCPAVSDTVKMKIIKIAAVNAGANQNVCSFANGVVLSGTVSGGVSSGVWSTNGSGAFNPSTSSLNASYSITAADVSAGSVIFTLTSASNGPCPQVEDTVKIRISSMATVNSGNNQSLCSSQSSILLNGAVLSASGSGSWTASGSGAFTPGASNLSTSYSMTSSDIANGFVTFTLSSTNNGNCPVVKDTVKITIQTLAVVNAGAPSLSICSTQTNVPITGTVNGPGYIGTWSTSGSGSFNPSPNNLNTSYNLSANDISSGQVDLVLTSGNNGPCAAVSDTIHIAIQAPAQVYAGPPQTICSSASSINLSGGVAGGPYGGSWASSGTGSFVPDNTSPSTGYLLSASDKGTGILVFTLFSTNNGSCPVITSAVNVTIKVMATVNAGNNQAICSTQSNIVLAGNISGSTSSGVWTTNGSGNFSPGPGSPNAVYNVSANDINNGTVLFILTSTNNDVCSQASDSLSLKITKKPILSLNLDSTICSRQYPFKLNAQFTGDIGAFLWVSSGTGTFVPNNEVPTDYFFTETDVKTSTVLISLNAVNNGPCVNTSAGTKLIIFPSAKAAFSASSYTLNSPTEPIIFTNNSVDADKYYWNFGDNEFTTTTSPKHTFPTVGFYTVTLIANNKYDCGDTTRERITIISDVQFPNVFTPNPSGSNGGTYSVRDYSNDVFFPYTAGVVEYDLTIFNRWGEIIFRSNNVDIGWDGYFNGKLCQQDAYVWKANIKFFDGRTYNKTGSVTLLR